MNRGDCNHDRAVESIAEFARTVGRAYPSTWSRLGTITLGGFCLSCGASLTATFDAEGRPVQT